MKEATHCEDCGYALKWDMLTGGRHDKDLCFGRQFQQVKAENKRLKESIKGWMNAWYDLREIIGKLWWHHPAIASDAQHAYYRNNLHELAKLRPVAYAGFVGTEADWHYQAWMKKR